MCDFSSYNRISLETSSPHTPVTQERRGFEGFLRCERTLCMSEKSWLSRRRQQTRDNAHSLLLCSPLFCAGELCADLRVVVVHEGRFFLKNGAQHRASDMRIKIACVGIRFSITTVVTTVVATVVPIVVTTVVTENRMPMHAIFFLMSDAQCRATIFFLNCVHFAHRVNIVVLKSLNAGCDKKIWIMGY